MYLKLLGSFCAGCVATAWVIHPTQKDHHKQSIQHALVAHQTQFISASSAVCDCTEKNQEKWDNRSFHPTETFSSYKEEELLNSIKKAETLDEQKAWKEVLTEILSVQKKESIQYWMSLADEHLKEEKTEEVVPEKDFPEHPSIQTNTAYNDEAL